MKVASLVVRARPERLTALGEALRQMPGVEVHAVQPEGRIVVTVEDVDGVYPAESIVSIHNLGGVIGVSLVYEYSDEETGSETEEAMQ
ncbi:MAG: chaperone NapD [Betaproteobacteria bacterium]|jgi:nitrate reductase NapD|nr:chaperone NapD [Betaproteobacteria bacterium]